jgi:hypothetical protein
LVLHEVSSDTGLISRLAPFPSSSTILKWEIYKSHSSGSSNPLLSLDSPKTSILKPFYFRNLSDEGPVGPTAFWKVTNGIGDIGADIGDHMGTEEDDDEDYDDDDDDSEDNQENEGFIGTVITISI